MDGRRFDEIAKSLASQTSRRAVVRTVAAGFVAGLSGVLGRPRAARGAVSALLGEACTTGKDCSGLSGVICCGANLANGTKGKCVDVETDPNNCGNCGVTCEPGKICTKGAVTGRCCVLEYGACKRESDCCKNNMCCEGTCVYDQDASANCGVCGRACKQGEACCNYDCVNLQRDPDHCGTCKNECPPEKSGCCNGRCMDVKRDRKNCGKCGNQCPDIPYHICEDGKCVRPKQTSVPGTTLPNLGYAALQPADLGSGFLLERGQMVYAPAALADVGFSVELAEALTPGFQAAFALTYQRPIDSGEIETALTVVRVLFDSDAAALAAVETMFFSHASFQADLTANYPMGDKGYTLLFEQPDPNNPDVMVPVLETGMYVGPMLTVIATTGAGASPDGSVHPEVAGMEEAFARLVASGQAPEVDERDGPGLAPLALQISGVPEANLFPARIDGKDVRSVGQTSETRANVKVAHGDATEVWLNNFTLPDSPYRIFNRIWAFDSAEAARAFGEQMPEPLLPTYESVGIELLDGKGSQLVDGQVSYDFTWPQPDGAWLGYQILFPLDRFYVSVSVADVAGPSDLPLLLRANRVMLSLEEIIRQYLEQLAEAIGKTLPFTLLPQIKPNALVHGKQPEAGEGKPSDASSSWSFERGTEVDAQILIYGNTIDRGEKPEVLPCDRAFVIRSFWEDRTVRTCDGYGGAKDGENDVCQTALKNASKMAATIPCPKEDCTAREETEIWRGWRCFEDEPEKGDHSATCAVELKITCNRDVRP
jgi:hypothetical protein